MTRSWLCDLGWFALLGLLITLAVRIRFAHWTQRQRMVLLSALGWLVGFAYAHWGP